jgi:hypothetical protein
MIELTEQEQQALDAGPPPLRLRDPRTNTDYVLIPANLYERFRGLLEDGLDMRQVAVLVERAMREYDADDPSLEYYQRKYGRKS